MTSNAKCFISGSTWLECIVLNQLGGDIILKFQTYGGRRHQQNLIKSSKLIPIGIPARPIRNVSLCVVREEVFLLLELPSGAFTLWGSTDLHYYHEYRLPEILAMGFECDTEAVHKTPVTINRTVSMVGSRGNLFLVITCTDEQTVFKLTRTLYPSPSTAFNHLEWKPYRGLPIPDPVVSDPDGVDAQSLLYRLITCCSRSLDNSPTRSSCQDHYNVPPWLDDFLFPVDSNHHEMMSRLRQVVEEAELWKRHVLHSPIFVVWEGISEITKDVMNATRTSMIKVNKLTTIVQYIETVLMGSNPSVDAESSLADRLNKKPEEHNAFISDSGKKWLSSIKHQLICEALVPILALPALYNEALQLSTSRTDDYLSRLSTVKVEGLQEVLEPYQTNLVPLGGSVDEMIRTSSQVLMLAFDGRAPLIRRTMACVDMLKGVEILGNQVPPPNTQDPCLTPPKVPRKSVVKVTASDRRLSA